MAPSPITSWQIDEEKVETVANFIFLVSRITEDGDCSHEIKRQHRQHIKKQIYPFADKDLYSQSYGFSSIHVGMWALKRKEGRALENWCFWAVVLEKTL